VGVYPDDPLANLDTRSGQAGGSLHDLSVELGQELARRLGVVFEAVVFESQPPLLEAVRLGSVDVMIVNATPKRAQILDFSPDLLQTEQGFLVMPDSLAVKIEDIDQSQVRVGVSEGSTSQGILTEQLKNARVVPVSTIKAAVQMLERHELDTFATNKAVLFALSDHVPGSRVLDGRYGVEHLALAIPKGRPKAMAYMATFVNEVTADGFLERAAAEVRFRGRIRTVQ
jgi:polar amino acid transport system substrate-binding protein